MTGIPWPLAVRVAKRVAGTHPLDDTYHVTALRRRIPAAVERAGLMVAEETGLDAGSSPEVAVVDRRVWIERNVDFFSRLLAPAEERIEQRVEQTGAIGRGGAEMTRRIVAAETGALLGVMARRVLGQYELVLPSDMSSGDTVYLVGSNILALERAHQFRPAEFRLWLALHECAHRAQFVAVPWLRDYFLGLVEQLVAGAQPEPKRFKRIVEEIRVAAAAGEDVIGETGLLGVFATPEQRELIDRVQALMSVLEGHGHVIMDRIGARELITQQRMSRVLKARRADPRTAAFYRLTGLEMKMRQYALGEKFILSVERIAGWQAVDKVWAGPEALPTLAEISSPETWLARVG